MEGSGRETFSVKVVWHVFSDFEWLRVNEVCSNEVNNSPRHADHDTNYVNYWIGTFLLFQQNAERVEDIWLSKCYTKM